MQRAGKEEGVSVSIRVRPISESERKKGCISVWRTAGVGANVLSQVTAKGVPIANTAYAFDNVFDGSATTAELYTRVASPVVNGVMDGINGTIFAYGQTVRALPAGARACVAG
jgi:hypothetical protein